ncbi:hypothetical protein HMPREF1577_01349 [Gardnerella pickettii JCP8017A]|uniref:Uncharacterized protein n=1 Tax=Gardnerella pickettii JCP8017A TaxID=1261062 RepID=T2PL30_9BIFI|nr:hypothetical protein HMPREF1577_01349 [Gardnerella pickettii JCP8017A]EPI59616.1 hypothetical protein HMPREF1578_01294 [Gardnerella pickettii JCP8017B]
MPSPIALCVIFIVILLALNTVLYFKSILDSKFLILLTTKYCSQSTQSITQAFNHIEQNLLQCNFRLFSIIK